MTSSPEPLAASSSQLPAKRPNRPAWSVWGVLLIVAFCAVAIGFSVVPVVDQVREGATKDYALWYLTAQRVAQGKDIYVRDEGGDFEFMYPPPAAALLAVPGQLGPLGLMLVLIGMTTASWLICILLSVYLASGGVRGRDPLLFWLPALCCISFTYDTYLLGQPAIVLAACIVGAFACLRWKMDWAAGALVALAAAIKAFPILVVGYFIYRKRWRATAFTAVFLALLLALPVVFRGLPRAVSDTRTWANGMLFHYNSDTIAQRPGRGYSWKNNSLQAVANRLLRPIPADHIGQHELYVNIADWPFQWINVAIVAFALGLCGAYIVLTSVRARRNRQTDAIEAAMILPLILVFTPLSFSYNWVFLIFPITLIAEFILRPGTRTRERWLAGGWLLACVLIFALTLPIPGFRVPRAMGNMFWACLLVFAELGWILRRTMAGAVEEAHPSINETLTPRLDSI